MYSINNDLITSKTVISPNVYATNHKEYVKGEVVVASYGDVNTTTYEYIVAETKTTTDANPTLVCIVQGTFNIDGLDAASNTATNIRALAANGIFGIKGGQ